jgi:hypothetical protein
MLELEEKILYTKLYAGNRTCKYKGKTMDGLYNHHNALQMLH